MLGAILAYRYVEVAAMLAEANYCATQLRLPVDLPIREKEPSMASAPKRPTPTIQKSTDPSIRLTPASLARLLSPLGIHARVLRIDGRCIRGYQLHNFHGAFAQFLERD